MVTMSSSVREEEWVVGCTVSLLTTLDEAIEGTVFAFDRLSNCVTLTQEGQRAGTYDLRVLKASCVKRVFWARAPETPVNLSLPPLDLTSFSSSTDPQPTTTSLPSEESERERPDRWADDEENTTEMTSQSSPRGELQSKPTPPVEAPPLTEPPSSETRPVQTERSRRENPWGLKSQKEGEKSKPTNEASTLVGSKQTDTRTPTPGIPSVAPQIAPKGPWAIKNPNITSKVPYAQVASSNANPTPTTQPETAKNPGVVTMSLKSRAPMRN